MIRVKVLIVATVFSIASLTAIAGAYYSGWGQTPQEAMENAMKSAKNDSPGGCICKGMSHDIEALCVNSKLGGFTCKACGSNHKGSCESQAEIDKILRHAEKAAKLFNMAN